MVILAVDDEKLALEALTEAVKTASPESEVYGFRRASEALEFAEQGPCDAAFLDISMRDMSGVDLAERLIALHEKINIIFTTGYSEYAGRAYEMHASGYIMKPVTPEKVKEELIRLRYDVPEKEAPKLYVRAFGNFEVYMEGGRPLRFFSAKSKELFAYLIDRNGAVCSDQEVIAALWEDDGPDSSDHTSYYRKSKRELRLALEENGFGDILVRVRGGIGILPDKVNCDYYEYLRNGGRSGASYSYRGEYMSQYSWSEFTHGLLEMNSQ